MFVIKEGKPKYLQFLDYLRLQIDEGELKPGDRLPSQEFLFKKYGLAQSTIERTHKLLEKDGYVERIERKGIFVIAPENRKSVAAGGLMNRSVLVLANGTAKRLAHHKQTGWSDYLTLGVINEIRLHSHNVMALDPNNMNASDIEYWMKHPPAGAILIGEPDTSSFMLETAHKLRSADVPVVLYGDEPELSDFDRVISDHEQGSYELTKWLLDRGCRRILRVREAGVASYWVQMRDRGYERALAEAGVKIMPPCLHDPYCGDDDYEQFALHVETVAQSLSRYLANHQPMMDAIMVLTDGRVNVLAAACRSLGLAPNRDVIFAGYDHYWEDVEEREFDSTAPLATIDKHNVKIGASMVQLLEDRIAGHLEDAPQCRKVAPQLLAF